MESEISIPLDSQKAPQTAEKKGFKANATSPTTWHRKRKPPQANPIQSAILKFLGFAQMKLLLKTCPKRYILYPPLLLLPSNFASYSVEWQSVYSSFTEEDKTDLFVSVASAFKSQGVSHIAINAPISSHDAGNDQVNVMRSPTGLLPVYGDFGPPSLVKDGQAGAADFEEAFWISATQNGGIVQVWAPLWTMFSRGNISEKARILGDGGNMKGLDKLELGQGINEVDVIDFYVGIGYFAFSYLKMGVRRVWGWEINEWSVEGLMRGSKKNGWDALVVRVNDQGCISESQMSDLVHSFSRRNGCEPRCIIFHGDNKWAAKVMTDVRCRLQAMQQTLNVRHANLGLLPSSQAGWENAVRCLSLERGAWLHVHENVDVREIINMEQKIVVRFQRLVHELPGEPWTVSCCHIERVKTYAPGVMHCVFDIQIEPAK